MLDDIRSFLQSGSHLESRAVRIDGATWEDRDLRLELSIMKEGVGVVIARWTIWCVEVLELSITDRSGGLVVHESGHVAARQHVEPRRPLFFTGVPSNVDATIGRLWTAHQRRAGAWIPFLRYFNDHFSLRDLLVAGFGKLAEGPNFLIEEYAQVLGADSITVSLGDPPPNRSMASTEAGRGESYPPHPMLTIERTFVVARDFREERRWVRPTFTAGASRQRFASIENQEQLAQRQPSRGTSFIKLNQDWNAEPNAPDPVITVRERELVLEFTANSFLYPRFGEGQRLRLVFSQVLRYRLGGTNDDGWYRGRCRFSGIAPRWGEFYEVTGDLRLEESPDDWVDLGLAASTPTRHFLFYLRDQTFECQATGWSLQE